MSARATAVVPAAVAARPGLRRNAASAAPALARSSVHRVPASPGRPASPTSPARRIEPVQPDAAVRP